MGERSLPGVDEERLKRMTSVKKEEGEDISGELEKLKIDDHDDDKTEEMKMLDPEELQEEDDDNYQQAA